MHIIVSILNKMSWLNFSITNTPKIEYTTSNTITFQSIFYLIIMKLNPFDSWCPKKGHKYLRQTCS